METRENEVEKLCVKIHLTCIWGTLFGADLVSSCYYFNYSRNGLRQNTMEIAIIPTGDGVLVGRSESRMGSESRNLAEVFPGAELCYPGPRGFLVSLIGKFCDANRFF